MLFAIKYLSNKIKTSKGLAAKIYLSKGEHFLFSCTNYISETFDASSEMSSYFNYCKLLFSKFPNESGHFSLDSNDNYNITIEPLFCSYGVDLGLLTRPNFNSLCVNPDIDPLPVLYVQSPNTMFNVTGNIILRSLNITGVNTLA